MEKISMIAPIGMSAPVVTEGLIHVEQRTQSDVSDVVVIVTNDDETLASVDLVGACLAVNRSRCRLHVSTLPFDDIRTSNQNAEFMRVLSSLIIREWEEGCSEVHLCIAGGRKDMCASATVIGQILNITSVFHVVMPEVRIANIDIERRRQLIKDLHNSEDKIEFYKKHQKELDTIMLPDVSTWYAIEIPLLPYPKKTLSEINTLLSEESIPMKDVNITRDILDGLRQRGYIAYSKNEVMITDSGKILHNILASYRSSQK